MYQKLTGPRYPEGSLVPASIDLLTTTKIYQTKITKADCNKLIEFASQHILQNAASLKNVVNVRTTNYNFHNIEGASPYIEPVLKRLSTTPQVLCRSQEYDIVGNFGDKVKGFVLKDSWVSFFNSDSVTFPHAHSRFINDFSFCAYLGDVDTSISFEGYDGWSTVAVGQGDMLIFPSYILHASYDTCEGRVIYAGNYSFKEFENLN